MVSPWALVVVLLFSTTQLILPGSASDVDFSTLPQCAWNDCFPFHSTSIGCTQFSLSCFCNALAPINCAAKNCTGNNWYAVEDWFDQQCPNPPNVTLVTLPECSRACIRDALIPQYCAAQLSRTCFCRLQTQFMGLESCLEEGCNVTSSAANETLADFYRTTCIYDPSADGNGYDPNADGTPTGPGGSTGVPQDEVAYAPSQGGESPADRLNLIIGLAAGFGSLIASSIGGYVFMHKCLGRRLPCGDFLSGEMFDDDDENEQGGNERRRRNRRSRRSRRNRRNQRNWRNWRNWRNRRLERDAQTSTAHLPPNNAAAPPPYSLYDLHNP